MLILFITSYMDSHKTVIESTIYTDSAVGYKDT